LVRDRIASLDFHMLRKHAPKLIRARSHEEVAEMLGKIMIASQAACSESISVNAPAL
jgi:hypothetical protein